MPELYIIAGSNGAGKSSVGSNYLPAHIRERCEIFDGDKLFMQKQKLLWQAGIRAIKEARNIAHRFVTDSFDNLVENAIVTNTHFVYEGHFINEATWDIPKRFKRSGYTIHIIFLGLANTALSQLRVIDRAKQGGHYVQPAEVEANFYGNLEKLNKYYNLFNTVSIIDTSEPKHTILVFMNNGNIEYAVPAKQLPKWFINGLPLITREIIG